MRPQKISSLAPTADLWWKNAIVYCIDIDSFMDLDGDGIGDFRGATQKIDYLAGIGVTCIWLQPFFPSPNRDNGYDIADYYGVDPRYGTLGDLVEFIRTATERGIRVIADLVINHTSIDHPWFQAAGDRESVFHDFYVWSDERPANADEGVVFPGYQHSTWSYDKRVDRWYMHRFYEHQPDLNINNPLVREEIHRIIGYWMQLGLSGFRVDAVPFIIEEVAGQNPAVADPHDYLRDIRAFMSRRRGDAILLAEANEPTEKLPLFFGDDHGDQMHMLFDFIGNQQMYLALVRGDARPIARALRRRPRPPETGQWAMFVKNHDEQTLDRLTETERNEVFEAFAPDPEMRIFGRGIRRRFASMVDGDRARMELMYSLCFSLPGTPVLFYGEEIGLGDDQSLEAREAVRVPMQWNSDPGAGFSTAPRAAMPRPPIEKGPFGYRRLNVEQQRQRRNSFLNWMEHLIRTRREWPEFGWGELRLLPAGDDAILAHTLEWQAGQVLAVHNLSGRRVRAAVRINEAAERGRWHYLLGSSSRGGQPADPGEGMLEIELEPYGYHWWGHREGP